MCIFYKCGFYNRDNHRLLLLTLINNKINYKLTLINNKISYDNKYLINF